jgi:(1->4)-alpha-D-glucan 1-alpha-D-glucosylmutase
MSTRSTTLTGPSTELAECLDRLELHKNAGRPFSTYRVQFNRAFRFEDARRLVPYLSQLGISHLYSSPILKARAGSLHGYDIIDHTQLNPEIGSEEELRALVRELKARGMGLLLDIVPNHMGVGHGTNPWWQDVLQNGRTSAYADFFDIDWEPLKPELRNKVLIPILGRQYGEELEDGKICVVYESGAFVVKYGEKLLPVDPQTIPLMFAARDIEAAGSDGQERALGHVLEQLRGLPRNDASDIRAIERRRHDAPQLLTRLAETIDSSPDLQSVVNRALERLSGSPGNSDSFDGLHRLLEAQVFRLAFWRVSAEEINYRRFFDINDLVGLRMENPRVFAETHKLMRRLLGDELISGVRVDHPDGLLDPEMYFRQLQNLYAASRCNGPTASEPAAADGIEVEMHRLAQGQPWTSGRAPLYVLVEKILEAGEELPEEWPIAGTVGYEFANLLNGILIDHRSERQFTNLYERVVGDHLDVESVIYRSKKLIMARALSSEVNVLTHIMDEISSRDRRARDFTRSVLRDAIRETIACFPVYRTYVDEEGKVNDRDRRYIQYAIDRAKRRNGNLASAVFDFLRSILLLEGNDCGQEMYGYPKQLYFTLKFQQLTSPVMAKGLEDTACYICNRFISVNEVGGSPAEFGAPVSEFHRENQMRAERRPHAMLTSSTHDTKRSEDVRARLDVLSEMPRFWAALVMKWRRVNARHKVTLADGRVVPDNNEEYLLYQTLVGAWPLLLQSQGDWSSFKKRIRQYMEKAIHEAKVNLSWLNPNPEYVEGLHQFMDQILVPQINGRVNLFWDTLQKLLPAVSYFGAINSLSQTLLKLASPGVPDIYQGQELWDFSLVDPDNRRPVDFDLRIRLFEELDASAADYGPLNLCRNLLNHWHDGRLKLWTTMRTLQFRQQYSELFRTGKYIPLQVVQEKEDHVVAFARVHGRHAVIAAVPRLSYTLMKQKIEPPLGPAWGNAAMLLPSEIAGHPLRNILTGEVIPAPHNHTLLCREVFASFPVALLSAV